VFSTWAERHAFLSGLFDGLCPWPSRLWLFSQSYDEVCGEYQYYTAGRALGTALYVLFLTGIAKLVLEVLM
jgi:hypothetical protein